MENCLVTKLKGTVDNSNLLKIGEFYADIKNSPLVQNQCTVRSNVPSTMTIVEPDHYFTVDGQQVTSVNFDRTAVIVNVPIENFRVKITNKYDLMTLYRLPVCFNDDDIKYSQYLTLFDGYIKGSILSFTNKPFIQDIIVRGGALGSDIEGNVSELVSVINTAGSSLSSIVIQDCPSFNGNISDLGLMNKNVFVTIKRCPVTGSLEGLVNNLKVTLQINSIRLILVGLNVTLGTVSLTDTSDVNSTLEWDNSMIVYKNGNTYYAKGASTAQIQEWQNAGKTVINCD